MPSKPGPRDTEIVVHPMLKFPFSGDTGDKVYSAKDHPSIMKEYATSSASSVTFLVFRTSRFSRRWRLLDPVTVEDVISASGDFWDELRVFNRAQVENGSVLAGWSTAYTSRTGATDMTCEGLVPRRPESFAWVPTSASCLSSFALDVRTRLIWFSYLDDHQDLAMITT